MFSIIDMFKVGVGPSSSHTVGPMVAAQAFAASLDRNGLLERVARVRTTLYGSLSMTGIGHGTDRAAVAGLEGNLPATVDTDHMMTIKQECERTGRLMLDGKHEIEFDYEHDVVFELWQRMAAHPNGMRFQAFDVQGNLVDEQVWYSIGGGFVRKGHPDDLMIGIHDRPPAGSSFADEEAESSIDFGPQVPYNFTSGAELVRICKEHGMSIADVVWANETAMRPADAVRADLLRIWKVMSDCVHNGCTSTQTTLPGGLDVPRRAPKMYRRLSGNGDVLNRAHRADEVLEESDSAWVNLFALAVNEENAGGGRIVTAPTNGASGIIPAVLHYYWHFVDSADEDGVVRFLLTAGAIGYLFKRNPPMCEPGRGRHGLLHGGRRPVRGDGRHARAGGERRGDRHRAQSGPHLRPGRRPGADPVHRAQRDGREHGDQRGAHRDARRRLAHRHARPGDQDDEGHRRGHDVQVQGDLKGRPRRQRRRMLRRAA